MSTLLKLFSVIQAVTAVLGAIKLDALTTLWAQLMALLEIAEPANTRAGVHVRLVGLLEMLRTAPELTPSEADDELVAQLLAFTATERGLEFAVDTICWLRGIPFDSKPSFQGVPTSAHEVNAELHCGQAAEDEGLLVGADGAKLDWSKVFAALVKIAEILSLFTK